MNLPGGSPRLTPSCVFAQDPLFGGLRSSLIRSRRNGGVRAWVWAKEAVRILETIFIVAIALGIAGAIYPSQHKLSLCVLWFLCGAAVGVRRRAPRCPTGCPQQ